ncbi:MAG: GntR protein [Frankiales bacterium]|nr:GntR protein [Frankiales bacterium]
MVDRSNPVTSPSATPSAPRRSLLKLAPIDVPRAPDLLAEQLRERILSGELTEGTALPPERDLVTQTRMSRTTVREALRILQVQGLVRIRAGRNGGAFVQRPGQESVASSVGLLIRGHRIEFAALLETREAIEPVCAQLAARHRTDEDLAVLASANAVIADPGSSLADFLQANVDWHVAVATATHNQLIAAFMMALSRAIYASTENEAFVDADVRRVTARAHRSIGEAIIKRDPAAAVRRMNRHIHSYAKAVVAVDKRTEIIVPGQD